jgi:hypothetical protein
MYRKWFLNKFKANIIQNFGADIIEAIMGKPSRADHSGRRFGTANFR